MLGITCAQIAMLTAQTALFLAGTLPGADFADRFVCALLARSLWVWQSATAI